MSLSPQEKLEMLEHLGIMPDGKKRKYDPGIYGPLKAKFLENVADAREAEG